MTASTTKASRAKVQTVMHEWKAGALHSGSPKGPLVTSRPQAIAIALSEQRQADKKRRGLLNGASA